MARSAPTRSSSRARATAKPRSPPPPAMTCSASPGAARRKTASVIEVAHIGIADVEAGGAITRGKRVKSDGDGNAVVASAANDIHVGVALASAADGDVFPVLLANRPGEVRRHDMRDNAALAAAPFETQTKLTAIAQAVTVAGLIADMVCPRVRTGYKFTYTTLSRGGPAQHPGGEGLAGLAPQPGRIRRHRCHRQRARLRPRRPGALSRHRRGAGPGGALRSARARHRGDGRAGEARARGARRQPAHDRLRTTPRVSRPRSPATRNGATRTRIRAT